MREHNGVNHAAVYASLGVAAVYAAYLKAQVAENERALYVGKRDSGNSIGVGGSSSADATATLAAPGAVVFTVAGLPMMSQWLQPIAAQ